MKNLTIKTILIGSFSLILSILITTVSIGFLATYSSEQGIKEIKKADLVLKDVSLIQRNFLESTIWAEIYLLRESEEAKEKYLSYKDKTFKMLNKLYSDLTDENLKKFAKDFEKKMKKYHKLVINGSKDNALAIEKMHENMVEIIDKIEKNTSLYKTKVMQKTHDNIVKDAIFMLIFSSVAIFLTILLSYYIYTFISRRLKVIKEAASSLASSDGDLTKRIPVIGKSEIDSVAKEINSFIQKVHDTVEAAKTNGTENSSVAAELSATALEIGQRAENEAALIADISQTGEEVFETLQNTVKRVTSSEENVKKASKTLESANKTISNLLNIINNAGAKESDLAQNIIHLQEEANGVKEVLNIISDIADQTNLLALNAAIEAARAGEHGRGFAVVADEVRKLAERTQKSLSEITATINLVIQSINDISGQMQSNAKEFEAAVVEVSAVEEEIKDVNFALNEAVTVSKESASNSKEIANQMQNVIENMRNITKISSQNARSVEEIAAAAEHLSKLTEELNHKLGLFKT